MCSVNYKIVGIYNDNNTNKKLFLKKNARKRFAKFIHRTLLEVKTCRKIGSTIKKTHINEYNVVTLGKWVKETE